MKRALLIPMLLLHLAGRSSAALTLQAWDFTGNTGMEESVLATTSDSHFDTSSITRAVGVYSDWALADSFTGYLWGNDVPHPELYFSFDLAPKSGTIYTVSAVSFQVDAPEDWSPTSLELRSSLDLFASTLGTPLTLPSVPNTGSHVVSLSGDPAFQNLSAPIEFRLYAYGDTTGPLGLKGTGNDLVIAGGVIPEAHVSSLLLAALLALLPLAAWLRHRHSCAR